MLGDTNGGQTMDRKNRRYYVEDLEGPNSVWVVRDRLDPHPANLELGSIIRVFAPSEREDAVAYANDLNEEGTGGVR
jgi:hypothetical protein